MVVGYVWYFHSKFARGDLGLPHTLGSQSCQTRTCPENKGADYQFPSKTQADILRHEGKEKN